MTTFRLILSGPCDAATNMATDEALFTHHREGRTRPVLRLYGWHPAVLSIGLSQNPRELLDANGLKRHNTGFVRRPTGGGIIYHDQEITYSLIASTTELGIQRYGVKASYEMITTFLIQAYRMMGLRASFAKDNTALPTNGRGIAAVCSVRAEEYDIVIDGHKIGGNAQKRSKDFILLHGSIPLEPARIPLGELLAAPLKDLAPKSASLSLVLAKSLTRQDVTDVLLKAFSRHFHAELQPDILTGQEKEQIKHLREDKYTTDDWNIRASDPAKTGPYDHRTQAALA